jgi:hypothetical protein
MRRAALAALLVAALLGAAPSRPPALETPSMVLAKYAEALVGVANPKYVTFEYAVEQAGFHNLVQTHRIYRSGLTERDEILSVDGLPLSQPSVRIIRNRVDRYGIAATSPKPKDYEFTYTGAHRVGSHYEYVFHTDPHGGGAFAVKSVAIDGLRYLPSQIVFSAVSGAARGQGRLSYAKYDKYWMVSEATVTAKVKGKLARERIFWTRYEFPATLPDSTFIAPRPVPTMTP